jgi:hypothetical protein
MVCSFVVELHRWNTLFCNNYSELSYKKIVYFFHMNSDKIVMASVVILLVVPRDFSLFPVRILHSTPDKIVALGGVKEVAFVT